MKNCLPFFAFLIAFLLTGCGQNPPEEEAEAGEVKTPVQVTTVQNAPITETFTLSATSAYNKKNIVRSITIGFIKKINVALGDYVKAGKPLFLIRTEEAEVLGDLTKNDTLLAPFKSGITIKAPASGTVREINFQLNDHVNDGDQLAVIADQSSFVFILNVPFEFSRYTPIGTSCTLLLPDSTRIPGRITATLGTVDTGSQTQRFIIVPQTRRSLPENLQVTVQLTKQEKAASQVVDNAAVLSDETMENFWVMKLLNDSTAVKVPVKKGIVSGEKIEILSPHFKPTDRLVTTGNYGLPDTALVTVLKTKRP
jgi:multidrug efflux pump subunit AcrA (membrane-fusion protein)